MMRLRLEELVQVADRITVVHCESQRSEWDAEGRRIFTTFELAVEEDVAGEGSRRVSLVQPGGVVGDIGQKTFGYTDAFAPDKKFLVFLGKAGEQYHVVGLSQGVFELQSAPGTQRAKGEKGVGKLSVMVQRLEGLHYLDDAGEPMRLERDAAIAEIRALWKKKVEK